MLSIQYLHLEQHQMRWNKKVTQKRLVSAEEKKIKDALLNLKECINSFMMLLLS